MPSPLSVHSRQAVRYAIRALSNLQKHINNLPVGSILDAQSESTELVPLLNVLNRTYSTQSGLVYLYAIGDQRNGIGDTVSFQPDYLNYTSHVLTFSATGLPAGITIAGVGGLISGAIGAGNVVGTTYSSTVTVTDGTNTATQAFNWSIVAQ